MSQDEQVVTVLTPAEKRKRRMAAAAHFSAGHTRAQVARILGVSRMTASRWFRSWKQGGENELQGRCRVGRLPATTEEQVAILNEILSSSPRRYGFHASRWTLALVSAVIEQRTGVKYHSSQVHKILNSLGWFYRPRGRARRKLGYRRGPHAWRKLKRHRAPNRRGCRQPPLRRSKRRGLRGSRPPYRPNRGY